MAPLQHVHLAALATMSTLGVAIEPTVLISGHIAQSSVKQSLPLDVLADVTVQYQAGSMVIGNNGGIFPSVPFYAHRLAGHRLSTKTSAHRFDVYVGPFCEESRHALTTIKNISDHYEGRLEVWLHLFPLTYNLGSFVVARAMHAVDLITNGTMFWPFVFELFDRQPKIKPSFASTMNNMDMVAALAKIAASYGVSRSTFVAQMTENATDPLANSEAYWRAKSAWKRGCARGVFATPSFFINDAQIPELGDGEGSTLAWLSFDHWKTVIDRVVAPYEPRLSQPLKV